MTHGQARPPPEGETDHEKALRRLGSRYARTTWNDAGYFDVPGRVIRDMVSAGHAESRKRGPSAPAEYRARLIPRGTTWKPPG